MNSSLYKKMAAIDDKHWWFKGRRVIIEYFIDKFYKTDSKARILDAGCGAGSNLIMLSKYGDAIGLDIDENMINISKFKSGAKVYKGNLPNEIPFDDGTFNLLTLLDVLEHLEEENSIKELMKKLKQGGKLVITVPALRFLWSSHDVNNGHYRRYSKKDIKELFEVNHLKIDYIGYFNFLLAPVIIIIRLIKSVIYFFYNKDDLYELPNFINFILFKIFSFEKYLLKYIRFPFGISIIAVGEKMD